MSLAQTSLTSPETVVGTWKACFIVRSFLWVWRWELEKLAIYVFLGALDSVCQEDFCLKAGSASMTAYQVIDLGSVGSWNLPREIVCFHHTLLGSECPGLEQLESSHRSLIQPFRPEWQILC